MKAARLQERKRREGVSSARGCRGPDCDFACFLRVCPRDLGAKGDGAPPHEPSTTLKLQGQLKRANIEYVVLAGSSLFLCERCTFVFAVCMRIFVGRIRLYVMWHAERWDNMILKEKWRSEC